MRAIPDQTSAPETETGSGFKASLWSPAFHSPWGETALVATMPVPLVYPTKHEGRQRWQGAKKILAGYLAAQLSGGGLPDLTLDSDPLGKPFLKLGRRPGPALAFSWCAEQLWAAVSETRNGLGLDAAAPGEFAGFYPFRRVFGEAEWQTAVKLAGGDDAEAAAMLWSIKEAVVKAKGCGFHFVSPRQVRVQLTGPDVHGFLWSGCLENRDWNRDFPKGRETCVAISIRSTEVWLALAWCR